MLLVLSFEKLAFPSITATRGQQFCSFFSVTLTERLRLAALRCVLSNSSEKNRHVQLPLVRLQFNMTLNVRLIASVLLLD